MGQPLVQTVLVRRGAIAETLHLTGRVGAQEEVAVSFPMTARIGQVAVTPGQAVDAGDLLVEADTTGLDRELTASRTRLDTARARLAKVQSVVQERLQKNQEEVDRIRASFNGSERMLADSAVMQARANLQRAEADLARLLEPPSPVDQQLAEQEVQDAQVTVQKAEAERARLRAGPDVFALRKAESELASAEIAYTKAEADLHQLLRGPDPFELRAAERAVGKAQASLQAAENAKGDKETRAAREAAVAQAQLVLADAEDNLARLKQPPQSWEVENARRTLANAQRTLNDARDRLGQLQRGPSELELKTVESALNSAQAKLAKAQERFQTLQNGPSQDQIAAAQSGLAGARNGLQAAQARVNELVGRQQEQLSQLGYAEARVAAVQAILDGTAEGDTTSLTGGDPELADLVLAQREVKQEQVQTERLERDLAAARLLAPSAGIVSGVLAKAGDPLAAGRPAVMLAKQGSPIIRIDSPGQEAARLTVGQQAVVQVEGKGDDRFEGTLSELSDTPTGRLAMVEVPWPSTVPTLGAGAQVLVSLQQKEGVLLVPQRALRIVGAKRFVDVVEGAGQRRVDVEIGITANGDAEVVSGLREGQQVVVGS